MGWDWQRILLSLYSYLNHLLHFQDKMQVLKHLSLPVLVLFAFLPIYSVSGSAGKIALVLEVVRTI